MNNACKSCGGIRLHSPNCPVTQTTPLLGSVSSCGLGRCGTMSECHDCGRSPGQGPSRNAPRTKKQPVPSYLRCKTCDQPDEYHRRTEIHFLNLALCNRNAEIASLKAELLALRTRKHGSECSLQGTRAVEACPECMLEDRCAG